MYLLLPFLPVHAHFYTSCVFDCVLVKDNLIYIYAYAELSLSLTEEEGTTYEKCLAGLTAEHNKPSPSVAKIKRLMKCTFTGRRAWIQGSIQKKMIERRGGRGGGTQIIITTLYQHQLFTSVILNSNIFINKVISMCMYNWCEI